MYKMDKNKNNLRQTKDNNPASGLDKLQEEISRLKKELEDKEWASRKTNEGIKILYKELEKKNEELKKLDELKSDFISNVSHELRTPLTTIREVVSQVLDGLLGETTVDQREFLSMCLEDIDRLRRIIDNLLDISKIEAGKVKLKRELVNIADLARKVCSTFTPRAKAKGLEIKAVSSGEDIEIYVDRDKVIQVFNNLVGNALKFTQEGYIEISVKDFDNRVECCISDTGKGMAQEDVPRVFDKFQQFGRQAGPGEKGTGLGLSIAKGIVELHKGDIWIESRLNEETKFKFTLPKYTALQLFRQSLAEGIKEAANQETSLSVLVFYIKDFEAVGQKVGIEKVNNVLHNLEKYAKINLRGKEDLIVKNTRTVLIMLPLTAKEDTRKVSERLQDIFNDFLSKEGLGKEIDIGCKVIGYPEDGSSDEELLEEIINQEDLK